MKNNMWYIAVCGVCGWQSDQLTVSKAQAAAKQHTNDNPHANYDDVPLFEGDTL